MQDTWGQQGRKRHVDGFKSSWITQMFAGSAVIWKPTAVFPADLSSTQGSAGNRDWAAGSLREASGFPSTSNPTSWLRLWPPGLHWMGITYFFEDRSAQL